MRQLLKFLIKLLPSEPIFAHCDIPCGIYDPHNTKLAAATVLKMVQKLKDEGVPNLDKNEEVLAYNNNITRYIWTKEEHARICKMEILILWTDYFNSEHLKKFPQLHELIWEATKLCSENKRHVDEVKARELVAAVDKIAEIFEQTKK